MQKLILISKRVNQTAQKLLESRERACLSGFSFSLIFTITYWPHVSQQMYATYKQNTILVETTNKINYFRI